MTYLNLWDWYQQAFKNKKSNRTFVNECHQNFLSFLRLKEWRELHKQLLEIVDDFGFNTSNQRKPVKQKRDEKSEAVRYAQIHRALLAGLLGNIGFKDGDNDAYSGARSIRFFVAPGSCLKKTRPKWVMAAALVDTSKLYARCVAKIEPDWIEPLARGLTNSEYTDPRWDRKKSQVTAWERVSLYGLTVVPKRRVHYGPINQQVSNEIFVREGLANMQLETKAPFLAANRSVIAEIEQLEHKARRQDVLVDEQVLFDFYAAIIPKDIVNGAGFEAWRKAAEESVTEVQFPETMEVDGATLALNYRFEPGHVLDGVTATVPLASTA